MSLCVILSIFAFLSEKKNNNICFDNEILQVVYLFMGDN